MEERGDNCWREEEKLLEEGGGGGKTVGEDCWRTGRRKVGGMRRRSV